jgi:hypothetical protein
MNDQSVNSSSQPTPQLAQNAVITQASWEAACKVVQHDVTNSTVEKTRALLSDLARVTKIIDYAIQFGRRPRRKDLERDVWDRSISREKFRKIVNQVLRQLPPVRPTVGKRRPPRVPRWVQALERPRVPTTQLTTTPSPTIPEPAPQQPAPAQTSAIPCASSPAPALPARWLPLWPAMERLDRTLGKPDLGEAPAPASP